jgi:ERCC4-type nuclease
MQQDKPAETVTTPLLVVADDREPENDVVAVLWGLPNVAVQIRRDYRVDERVVFERKTVADFAASILDQRLFLQAAKLARYRLPAVFILEGRPSDMAAVGLRRETMQGAMITLTLIYRLA